MPTFSLLLLLSAALAHVAPRHSRTTPQTRRYLIGHWHPCWFMGGPAAWIAISEKGQSKKRDKVIGYHWICWETPTYPGGCLLRSRVLGPTITSHPSVHPELSRCMVHVLLLLPHGDASRQRTKRTAKQSCHRTSSGKMCLRTLYPPTQTKTASIMIIITCWNTSAKFVSAKFQFPYFSVVDWCLLGLRWIFFNCSVTCIRNISNTAAGVADIC